MKNSVDSSRPLYKDLQRWEEVSIQLPATEMHPDFLRQIWKSHVSDWSSSQDNRLHM